MLCLGSFSTLLVAPVASLVVQLRRDGHSEKEHGYVAMGMRYANRQGYPRAFCEGGALKRLGELPVYPYSVARHFLSSVRHLASNVVEF